jgi:glutamine amidotransferase
MCRLFGFRSVIPSQMHRSLVVADNALCAQSAAHPDGWGVAYYVDGAPHLTRATQTAQHDQLFHRVSGVVSSETVLAHVRRATQGTISVLNTHPFQHGRWVFAHNGDIPGFADNRSALVAKVAERLRRFILGDTDSEVLFFVFLTELEKLGPLAEPCPAARAIEAIARTTATAREIFDRDGRASLLTFIATDGVTMVASQGGRELHWSSYKRRCADRDSCPSLAPYCEAPSPSGRVNHLILSSEPLGGENVWLPLSQGEVIAVDGRMTLERRAPS